MDTLRFYRQTAAQVLLRWLMMVGFGIVFSVFCIVTALLLLGNGGITPVEPTASWLANVWARHLWPILLILSSIVFAIVYVVLAGKISLHSIIQRLYAHQLAPAIAHHLTRVLTRLIQQQPEWWQAIDSAKTFKAKLAQAADAADEKQNKHKPLHPLQRKAMRYALHKTELADINFNPSNPNLANEIGQRVMSQLDNLAQPMFSIYWVAVSIHFAILALALTLDQ